jgi:hypothetical protein
MDRSQFLEDVSQSLTLSDQLLKASRSMIRFARSSLAADKRLWDASLALLPPDAAPRLVQRRITNDQKS